MSRIDGDPYDNGTPKYYSATDIYDSLRDMARGEEIGILSEMFSDISWDGQDYYYTDNGSKLVERWEEMTDFGNSMWLMDVAVWQLSEEDANEWIYQILCNDDLSKRIGFKKIFIETALGGMPRQSKEFMEAFGDALGELDRNDFYANSRALAVLIPSVAWDVIRYRYGNLCSAVYSKLKGLRLEEERRLIVESRAMLTGYDDFMFGLRSNQALFTEQERLYRNKVALLQEKYEVAKRYLLSEAQKQGIVLRLPDSPLLIADGNQIQEVQP